MNLEYIVFMEYVIRAKSNNALTHIFTYMVLLLWTRIDCFETNLHILILRKNIVEVEIQIYTHKLIKTYVLETSNIRTYS